MTVTDIITQRLSNQHLADNLFTSPEEVVGWLGAVQSQDYSGASWAIAQRVKGTTTSKDIDNLFNAGRILRTHVMRPTWHFVLPEDIRWMQSLTAPYVNKLLSHYYRKFELDDMVFTKANKIIINALKGDKHLTRSELAAQLQQGGIDVTDLVRLSHITAHAEIHAVICSGALRGKQHTYALLDERVPATKALSKEESLARLLERYFQSHGPATIKDFTWWSGLPVAEATNGLSMIKSRLLSEDYNGQTYWFTKKVSSNNSKLSVQLLANYDEYIVAYKDRNAVIDTSISMQVDARNNILFNHTILMDGKVVGAWKRTIQKNTVVMSLQYFVDLTEDQKCAVKGAAERYGAFLELPLTIKD